MHFLVEKIINANGLHLIDVRNGQILISKTNPREAVELDQGCIQDAYIWKTSDEIEERGYSLPKHIDMRIMKATEKNWANIRKALIAPKRSFQ